MAWVKIDDGFADHPKILQADPREIVAHLRALCYCARHLTDGHLSPKAATACLAGLRLKPRDMIRAKFWEKNGIGYVVHDFLHYNPSATQVRALREARGRAGRLGYQALVRANAQAAAGHLPGHPDPTPSSPSEKGKCRQPGHIPDCACGNRQVRGG